MLGIDVSSHQPSIDWRLVANSLREAYNAQRAEEGLPPDNDSPPGFAIVKVTEDADYANPNYARQVTGARRAGLLVGHYHYARPETRTADILGEVEWLLAQADIRPGEPVALDLEEGGGDLTEWALTWLQAVEARTGRRPLIYTYPYFAQAHISRDARLARYPLWFADYNTTPRAAPWPWPYVTIRQFTADGRVDGIPDTVVDLNSYDGTAGTWKLLAGAAAAIERAGSFRARWQQWRRTA